MYNLKDALPSIEVPIMSIELILVLNFLVVISCGNGIFVYYCMINVTSTLLLFGFENSSYLIHDTVFFCFLRLKHEENKSEKTLSFVLVVVSLMPTRKYILQGFRKIDPDQWEFANEGFHRGHKHLLKDIRRRKPPSQAPSQNQPLGHCIEVGCFGLHTEVERLRRDKNLLLAELVKLRQEQQGTRAQLQDTEQRLQSTVQKQHQVMAFLAKAIYNPTFLQHLAEQKEKREDLEEAINRKRRMPIDQVPASMPTTGGNEGAIGIDSSLFDGDLFSFQVPGLGSASELETLALEMQGLRAVKRELGSASVHGSELSDEFWKELLDNMILNEENAAADYNEQNDDDVNLLTDK